jgi:1-acyl-sn-glycerol-3-phosphate acyltransferase
MSSPKTYIPKPVFKKPNFFVYILLYLATVWAKVFFRIKIDKKGKKAARNLKGPVLLLGTHRSPVDFAIMVNAIFPKKMTFVVAEHVYFEKGVGGLIRALRRCIPKKQFMADISTVKNIKKMIDAGVSVGLYPEGRCTVDGRGGEIGEATGKLVKWLGVPVVFVKSYGSYHSRPRYGNGLRRGKIISEILILVAKEEARTLSVAEINRRIKEAADVDEFKYQRDNKIAFIGKAGPAEGFENLLYKCPKCGREFTVKSSRDELFCEICGNRVKIDEKGFFTPVGDSVCFEGAELWYDYQREELKKEIAGAENYSLSAECYLFVTGENYAEFSPRDKGIMTLSAKGFAFKGEREELFFRLPSLPRSRST